MACLRGPTVSQTQAASPQTAQRLRWQINPAICTYQRTLATHGHAAIQICQPLAAFSSVDQGRIILQGRCRYKSAFQLFGNSTTPKTASVYKSILTVCRYLGLVLLVGPK